MHAIKKTKSPLSAFFDVVMDPYAANFWLQKVNPLWSVNQALGSIVKKEIIATDTVALTFEFNGKFQVGAAGQHHPIFVVVNGVRYERTYSLTQLNAKQVLLVAKKVDKGVVSQWLFEQAKLGDILEFGRPYGDMQLPEQNQPLVLLAAGSGITPMHSLIQALLSSGKIDNTAITLMYWVKTEADAAFKEFFEKLAEKYENFKFELFCTQTEKPASRLDESHLATLKNVEESTVYACGPSGFTAQVETLFSHAQTVKTEAFSMTPVLHDEIGFVNVTLTQSNKVVAIPKGQPILLGLEQQNIKPKHGCRMGICNKCACNKAEGSTKNLVNGAQNSEPGNLLKICVNSAQTDLVIDL